MPRAKSPVNAIRPHLREILGSNILWAAKALIRIWEHQTQAEVASNATLVWNDVGFSSCDADFGSSLAEQANRWFNARVRRNPRSPFSPKQEKHALRIAKKYSRQIAELMVAENPEKAIAFLRKHGEDASADLLAAHLTSEAAQPAEITVQ